MEQGIVVAPEPRSYRKPRSKQHNKSQSEQQPHSVLDSKVRKPRKPKALSHPRFQVKILNFFPCRHTLLVFRVLKSESKGSFLEGTKLEPFSFFSENFGLYKITSYNRNRNRNRMIFKTSTHMILIYFLLIICL